MGGYGHEPLELVADIAQWEEALDEFTCVHRTMLGAEALLLTAYPKNLLY